MLCAGDCGAGFGSGRGVPFNAHAQEVLQDLVRLVPQVSGEGCLKTRGLQRFEKKHPVEDDLVYGRGGRGIDQRLGQFLVEAGGVIEEDERFVLIWGGCGSVVHDLFG